MAFRHSALPSSTNHKFTHSFPPQAAGRGDQPRSRVRPIPIHLAHAAGHGPDVVLGVIKSLNRRENFNQCCRTRTPVLRVENHQSSDGFVHLDPVGAQCSHVPCACDTCRNVPLGIGVKPRQILDHKTRWQKADFRKHCPCRVSHQRVAKPFGSAPRPSYARIRIQTSRPCVYHVISRHGRRKRSPRGWWLHRCAWGSRFKAEAKPVASFSGTMPNSSPASAQYMADGYRRRRLG